MSMKTKTGELPAVRVDIPEWAALQRARRRLETMQSITGRLATIAGACAAAGGMFTTVLDGWTLLADGALTLAGLVTLRLWRPSGLQKATASALYLIPGVSLGVLLAGQWVTPNMHPVWSAVEATGLLVWTVGTWVARPAEAGRRMLAPRSRPVLSTEPGTAVVMPASQNPYARWWAQHAAVKGVAPGTVLEDVRPVGGRGLRAVIRSTIPGKPVPDVPIKTLSALMDVPEEDISITAVPGRGAGVRLLTVGQTEGEAGQDAATVWEQRIAPVAMPGAVLTGMRVGRPAVLARQEQGEEGES